MNDALTKGFDNLAPGVSPDDVAPSTDWFEDARGCDEEFETMREYLGHREDCEGRQ